MLSIIKNAIKNRSSLILKINLFLLKTLITVPTILEMSFYAFTFTTNLIYTLKKKGFKAIVKAFQILCLRELLTK